MTMIIIDPDQLTRPRRRDIAEWLRPGVNAAGSRHAGLVHVARAPVTVTSGDGELLRVDCDLVCECLACPGAYEAVTIYPCDPPPGWVTDLLEEASVP